MYEYQLKDLSLQKVADLANTLKNDLADQNIICLQGDLGAGKTSFSQFLIKNIIGNSDVEVTSPTYNIVHTYQIDLNKLEEVWHFDLYRIKSDAELVEIGFFDALANYLCIIEWPEVANQYLPQNRIDISISFGSQSNLRNFEIKSSKCLKLLS